MWGYVSWLLFPVLIVVAAAAVAIALLPDRLLDRRRGKAGGRQRGEGGGEAGMRGTRGRLRRAEVSDPAFRIRVIDDADDPGEAAGVVGEVRERGATDVSEPEVVPVLIMSEPG